jgi:hypothetical protein
VRHQVVVGRAVCERAVRLAAERAQERRAGIDRPLEHVPSWRYRQIGFDRPNLPEEADVVIAVASREAPGAAARFDSKQDPHRFLPFNRIQLRLDARSAGLMKVFIWPSPASSTEVRQARQLVDEIPVRRVARRAR